MQIHQLKPKHKKKNRKRVGRGGKRGTYSGKGLKGQKSRAGRKTHPIIRDFIKKYPKLRGYRAKRIFDNLEVVNVGDLDKYFDKENIINPKALLEKGLIRKIKGKIPRVKILGKGELTKELAIEGCEMSKSVKEKIKNPKSK